ncbi:MAG: leucine--tRNA ligase [Thermoplasmata archaeon]|nr:MAG: leucine--tRNA ligase [Thermoplasmata archaeon]
MEEGQNNSNYIENKWQQKWNEAKIFETEPLQGQKKYFLNFPYPYMNGYMHLGHAYTLLRVDVYARFKRMMGFNVLFPFAFHCTGSPIVSAADRIKEKDPKQMKIMEDMGIPSDLIPRFAEPVYWTEFFPDEYIKDVIRFGVSIDWRRRFITTSLNPLYNKFIEWQFRKLKAKDYVVLGEHPVVWCTKCKSPVGDHARIKGEGETPQEMTLLKFKFEDAYIIAATLRPETVYGQTNMWVDVDLKYVKAKVGDEIWIVSKECAHKLKEQKEGLEIVGEIWGGQMIGKTCVAPGINREILILPSEFCDPNKGTGLVTSVPSDAPDDWMGLYDLYDDSLCNRYGLDCEKIKKIKPIPIIDTPGWGDLPAVKICEEMKITSQHDREKLEEAKKIIYKSGFYTGVMNENCGEYLGMKVEEAKDLVKEKLIASNDADVMYELSGDVVCRCLTPSIVKVVSNQWFIAYGSKEWKKAAHSALNNLKLFPEGVRKQFEYVLDWLNDWACTREFGLGTRLPWDENWVIESLSDSTIYMAYYTISKYLEHEKIIPPEKITDPFFDYIFLGEGEASAISHEVGISESKLSEMRNEFEYWYPFDLRVSGKDLVQNHLSFCLFNHVAIFPEKHWPLGFGLNGWILVSGAKMSKSAGNFYPLRDILDRFGADGTRLTLSYSGEGIDDPNFNMDFASGAYSRLETWRDFAINNYDSGREEKIGIDAWFESVLNRSIKEVTQEMEEMKFRTALKIGFFDLQRHLRWYKRRCLGKCNKAILNKLIVTQTKFLAPVTPHICEEIWEKLGFSGFISLAEYPKADLDVINLNIEMSEELLINTISDINEILKVTGIKPEKIVLYTPSKWKHDMHHMAVGMSLESKLGINSLMKKAMTDPNIKKHSKEASQYAKKLVEDLTKRGLDELERLNLKVDEMNHLLEAKDFLKHEFGCEIEIYSQDDEARYDPKDKTRFAVPFRPAIFIE